MILELAYVLRCKVDVLRHERGAAMVEYSLLVALIALIAIGAVRVLGSEVSENFSSINSDIDANS